MKIFISLQGHLVCRTNLLLGTAFNTSLEVTRPASVLDPTQLLSLNCFVLGDKPEQMFTVKIPKTDNVSTLKKLIKEEKARHFNHVDADSLVLWKSSIPFNRNLNEDVETLKLVNDNALLPVEILSNVFPSVLGNKTVHIIVDRLHSDEQHDSLGDLPEFRRTLWFLFLPQFLTLVQAM